ncbi:hypothetical protein C8Q79DRAFT_489039 [Trametes meyenii]|nr:hypothetical protein C8Q79DRAFT_489039 [Trametes meyenii]
MSRRVTALHRPSTYSSPPPLRRRWPGSLITATGGGTIRTPPPGPAHGTYSAHRAAHVLAITTNLSSRRPARRWVEGGGLRFLSQEGSRLCRLSPLDSLNALSAAQDVGCSPSVTALIVQAAFVSGQLMLALLWFGPASLALLPLPQVDTRLKRTDGDPRFETTRLLPLRFGGSSQALRLKVVPSKTCQRASPPRGDRESHPQRHRFSRTPPQEGTSSSLSTAHPLSLEGFAAAARRSLGLPGRHWYSTQTRKQPPCFSSDTPETEAVVQRRTQPSFHRP